MIHEKWNMRYNVDMTNDKANVKYKTTMKVYWGNHMKSLTLILQDATLTTNPTHHSRKRYLLYTPHIHLNSMLCDVRKDDIAKLLRRHS